MKRTMVVGALVLGLGGGCSEGVRPSRATVCTAASAACRMVCTGVDALCRTAGDDDGAEQ